MLIEKSASLLVGVVLYHGLVFTSDTVPITAAAAKVTQVADSQRRIQKFCSYCGTQLPQPFQGEQNQWQPPVYCFSCGQKLPEPPQSLSAQMKSNGDSEGEKEESTLKKKRKPERTDDARNKKRKKLNHTEASKIKIKVYPQIEYIEEEKIKENDLFSWAYWYECHKDPKNAHRHYLKAISANGKRDARAYYMLAVHYEAGSLSLQKKVLKAKRYYIIAAEGNCSEAQFKLGYCYASGKCAFEKDINQALFWYEKAANNPTESLQAYVNLGILFEHGKDVPKHNKKAFEYYKKAEGSPDGQYRLSLCFKNGIGTEIDPNEATRLLKLASSNGSAEATVDLGMQFEKNKEYAQAIECYNLAATLGSSEGHYNLGVCFEEGLPPERDVNNENEWVVKKDIGKAKEHYKLAGNNTEAQDALAKLSN